jgi:lipopolysaccharide export system protein LptA
MKTGYEMRDARCGMLRRIGLGVLLPILFVTAQEPGAEVSGFRVPEYDANGVMTSQLFGDKAEMQGGGVIQIIGVRAEFYRDGETFMTVTSPTCFYNQSERTATSDAAVAADLEGVRLRGTGFELSADERVVQVKKDSRVVISDVMQQSGLDAAETATNETVITSDQLFLDYNARTAHFVDSVHVDDSKIELDSESLEVRFDENNEINWIEALGAVRILHEGREANADQAVYDVETDEFLLQGSPRIVEGKNMLMGDRIRFWRASERMICEPSARLVVFPDQKMKTGLFEK